MTNVEDAPKSTQLLAATTLRNVLGTRTLQEILADRESIAQAMQVSIHSLGYTMIFLNHIPIIHFLSFTDLTG